MWILDELDALPIYLVKTDILSLVCRKLLITTKKQQPNCWMTSRRVYSKAGFDCTGICVFPLLAITDSFVPSFSAPFHCLVWTNGSRTKGLESLCHAKLSLYYYYYNYFYYFTLNLQRFVPYFGQSGGGRRWANSYLSKKEGDICREKCGQEMAWKSDFKGDIIIRCFSRRHEATHQLKSFRPNEIRAHEMRQQTDSGLSLFMKTRHDRSFQIELFPRQDHVEPTARQKKRLGHLAESGLFRMSNRRYYWFSSPNSYLVFTACAHHFGYVTTSHSCYTTHWMCFLSFFQIFSGRQKNTAIEWFPNQTTTRMTGQTTDVFTTTLTTTWTTTWRNVLVVSLWTKKGWWFPGNRPILASSRWNAATFIANSCSIRKRTSK